MIRYELVALLHPDLEINLDSPLRKIEKFIQDADGKVVKQDNWGKRKLAYPIRRQDFAVYIYWEADLPADNVAKLDRSLNITDEVLRHLITKHVEAPVSVEDSEKQAQADANTKPKTAKETDKTGKEIDQ